MGGTIRRTFAIDKEAKSVVEVSVGLNFAKKAQKKHKKSSKEHRKAHESKNEQSRCRTFAVDEEVAT